MIAKRVTAITSLLLTLAAGCHHGAFANTPVGTQGAVGLVVQNQNFYDMDLYVVSEGVATRVGDDTKHHLAVAPLVSLLQRVLRLRIVIPRTRVHQSHARKRRHEHLCPRYAEA